MKTILCILLITISLSTNANFIGKLMEKAGGGPKELPVETTKEIAAG